MDKTIFECETYLCAECRKKSGDGNNVTIHYTNSGGWSPKWEGRVCDHLTVADILEYLEKYRCE